jgi:hypothetical protein
MAWQERFDRLLKAMSQGDKPSARQCTQLLLPLRGGLGGPEPAIYFESFTLSANI